MNALPGRCHIGADGLLRGPTDITHNVPMPTRNGTPGGFGTAWGGVIHTEVGFEHSVIEEFNNPGAQASAFFSISMTGAIHQYGTLGHDWAAWTQAAGNAHYRGVEHEDHGNPSNPMTEAQLSASAQVFEAMSAFDGWPLEPTDNPNGGRGVIFHVDGGQPWGGHECPGPVRMRQRGDLLRCARAIRDGSPQHPAASGVTEHTTAGHLSIAAFATQQHTTPAAILEDTVLHSPGRKLPANVSAYLNGLCRGSFPVAQPMPAGLHLHLRPGES